MDKIIIKKLFFKEIKIKIKSQIFYLDFLLGLSIFLIIFLIAINLTLKEKNNDSIILREAEKLSNYLLSEGIPKNWSNETLYNEEVIFLGILSNESLDINKLNNFILLCDQNYSYVKNSFSLKSDFYLFFEDTNSNIINLSSFDSSFNFSSNYLCKYKEDKENFITFIRYVIYRHDNIAEILKMNVVVYDN